MNGIPFGLISVRDSGSGAVQFGSQFVFPSSTSHFPQKPSITSFLTLTSVAHHKMPSCSMHELWVLFLYVYGKTHDVCLILQNVAATESSAKSLGSENKKQKDKQLERRNIYISRYY